MASIFRLRRNTLIRHRYVLAGIHANNLQEYQLSLSQNPSSLDMGQESSSTALSGSGSKSKPGLRQRARNLVLGDERSFRTNLSLMLMAAPGVLFLLVFAYLPMIGLVMHLKIIGLPMVFWVVIGLV